MATDLQNLYRRVVLEHNRHPRNFGAFPSATHRAQGSNPLCGDRVELFLEVAGDTIQTAGFEGEGCAICNASASMLTEALAGQPLEAVRALEGAFQGLLQGELSPEQAQQRLGDLAVFAGLAQHPARIKCATLAWRTLEGALACEEEPVSTE